MTNDISNYPITNGQIQRIAEMKSEGQGWNGNMVWQSWSWEAGGIKETIKKDSWMKDWRAGDVTAEEAKYDLLRFDLKREEIEDKDK